MLKIRILNSRTPTELKELDLHPETMLNQECLIGRSTNCGLVLENAEVSRLHGKFFVDKGKYYFADLASACGSWINAEKAKVNHGYLLKVGELIRIPGFVLMIAEVASPDEPTVIVPPMQQKTVVAAELPTSPVIVEEDKIERWTKGELTVRCVRVIDETVDVKTFCFVANPPVLFAYKPGQFVTLELEINGEQVSRSYSISSTPSRPHTLEITIKRVPPPPDCQPNTPRGLISNWLHENITAGSEIKLSGPLGKFTCFANPCQKLLMISAGSGITPMMSMSRWLLDTASGCDIVFFHSARSPRDIIFRQELELMSARHHNFNLAITTTRKEPGQSWLGLTGRLNPAMLQTVSPDFMERTVYVCGPNTFMEGIKQMLEGLGFPMQNYYEESFGPRRTKEPKPVEQKDQPTPINKTPSSGGFRDWMKDKLSPVLDPIKPNRDERPIEQVPVPPPPPIPSPSTPSQLAVFFKKSGKEVACDGEEPILDLAEQGGVKIRFSCRIGSCGTCKKLKLEGEVKMEGYSTLR